MTIRLPARPREDPLVEDAVKPKAEPHPVDFWRGFPAPNAKRKPCGFCGDELLVSCSGDEHERCLNFKTAERHKRTKAHGQDSTVA